MNTWNTMVSRMFPIWTIHAQMRGCVVCTLLIKNDCMNCMSCGMASVLSMTSWLGSWGGYGICCGKCNLTLPLGGLQWTRMLPLIAPTTICTDTTSSVGHASSWPTPPEYALNTICCYMAFAVGGSLHDVGPQRRCDKEECDSFMLFMVRVVGWAKMLVTLNIGHLATRLGRSKSWGCGFRWRHNMI